MWRELQSGEIRTLKCVWVEGGGVGKHTHTPRILVKFLQSRVIFYPPVNLNTQHAPLPPCSMHFIFTYLQEGKIMPVKYEESSFVWVAVGQPVKDNSFLSAKVIELCGDLPIFWLKPTYPKGNTFKSLNAAWKAACPGEVPGSPPRAWAVPGRGSGCTCRSQSSA